MSEVIAVLEMLGIWTVAGLLYWAVTSKRIQGPQGYTGPAGMTGEPGLCACGCKEDDDYDGA